MLSLTHNYLKTLGNIFIVLHTQKDFKSPLDSHVSPILGMGHDFNSFTLNAKVRNNLHGLKAYFFSFKTICLGLYFVHII